MPYTRPWVDVNNLLGTRDADEIDDGSRETHVDLTERFSDILYDVAADPWKVKVPGVASDGTQNVVIGAVNAVLIGANIKYDIADLAVRPVAVSIGGSCIINLSAFAPRGSTIKAFSVRVLCQTGATVTITLRKISDVGANTNVVIVSATPGASIQDVSSGAALTEMITSLADYYLEVNLVANGTVNTSASLFNVNVVYKLSGTP